jgi:DNA-binding NtrC family response regulator
LDHAGPCGDGDEAVTIAEQCMSWARFPEAMVPSIVEEAPLTLRERLLLSAVLETVAEAIAASPGTLLEMEREAITNALLVTGGSQRQAAKILGITERVINFKMKNHGLPRPRAKAVV